MVQLVGYLAETVIVLTGKEASALALVASQAAHALDDPRYNGQWDAQTKDQLYALDHDEDTTRHIDAWTAQQFDRDTQQMRWIKMATLLDPDTYQKKAK